MKRLTIIGHSESLFPMCILPVYVYVYVYVYMYMCMHMYRRI